MRRLCGSPQSAAGPLSARRQGASLSQRLNFFRAGGWYLWRVLEGALGQEAGLGGAARSLTFELSFADLVLAVLVVYLKCAKFRVPEA